MAFTGVAITHGPSAHSQQYAGLQHAVVFYLQQEVTTVRSYYDVFSVQFTVCYF